jgi:hypothetical protein
MKRNFTFALIYASIVCLILFVLNEIGIWRSGALRIESILRDSLVIGEKGLRYHPLLQCGVYLLLAYATAWYLLEVAEVRLRVIYLAGSVMIVISMVMVMALVGVVFEPWSGIVAIGLSAVMSGVTSGTLKNKYRYALQPYFEGRLSEAGFEQLLSGVSDEVLFGVKKVAVLGVELSAVRYLRDTLSPEAIVKLMGEWKQWLDQVLLPEGAYLLPVHDHRFYYVFGYPNVQENSVEQATRAMKILQEKAEQYRKDQQAPLNDGASKVYTVVSEEQVYLAPPLMRQVSHWTVDMEWMAAIQLGFVQARVFGVDGIIHPNALKSLDGLRLYRPVGSVIEAGKTLEFYQPLTSVAEATVEQVEAKDLYWKAYILEQRKNLEEACALLEECERLTPGDDLVNKGIRRLQGVLKNG